MKTCVQLADQLTAAVGTLTTTATMLVVPAAALVGWAVFLRPSSNAAGQFGREAAPGTVEQPNLEANYKEEPFVAFSAEAGEPVRSARAWPGGYGGWALIGLGVLILLFAAMDSLQASSRLHDVHAGCRRDAGRGSAGDPRHLQRRAALSLDAVARLPARRAQCGRHLARCPRDQPARGERHRAPDARSHSSAAWQGAIPGPVGRASRTSAASPDTARSLSASACPCRQTTTASLTPCVSAARATAAAALRC